MAFYDENPSGRLAEQRARADIVMERLAACVFAGSGASAAFFEHSVLAAVFVTVAIILVCISIFASIKFRRNHPGPNP